MWIDDLAPYTYGCEPEPNRLAVGWLDSAEPFNRGAAGPKIVHDRFVSALKWAAVNRSVDAYRGYHFCELGTCTRPSDREPGNQPAASFAGGQMKLGHAQIEVEDADGIRHVAPNLVVHYVEAHDYRPPDTFVRAALVGEWRRPDRTPGSYRLVGPGIAIDEWSPELASILWEEVAAALGTDPAEAQRLVQVEVRPSEVACIHTHAGLPSVVVWITPSAAKWVKATPWLPTTSGTRELAAWLANAITRATR
ncbi:MAG: hypothetical protein GY745_19430 [Actinomycetia bacterium]|nr:hypothetical protein [Actinomycetes bacterium]